MINYIHLTQTFNSWLHRKSIDPWIMTAHTVKLKAHKNANWLNPSCDWISTAVNNLTSFADKKTKTTPTKKTKQTNPKWNWIHHLWHNIRNSLQHRLVSTAAVTNHFQQAPDDDITTQTGYKLSSLHNRLTTRSPLIILPSWSQRSVIGAKHALSPGILLLLAECG